MAKREIKQRYLVLDCETGGLNCLENPITEIAMVALDKVDFSVVNQWETVVKPYANLQIVPEALKTTGLKLSDINKGRTVEDMVKVMIQFIDNITPLGDRGRNKPIIVGHNVGFDIRFIDYAFGLVNKQLFDYVDSTTEERDKPREGYIYCLDTYKLSREHWQDEGKFTLSDCCRRIGFDHVDAHRAMPDVGATIKLFRYLMERMVAKKMVNKVSKEEDKEMQEVQELLDGFEF